MKDYTRFSVNDLVLDEFFQSWIFDPDEKTNRFWQSWLLEYPHKVNEVEEARSILLRLDFTNHSLDGDEVSSLWSRIRETEHKKATPTKHLSVNFVLWSGAVAASIAIFLGFFFWVNIDSSISYETAFGETRKIVLPDSSTVILNSNSSLKLISGWSDKKRPREVWLEGEAFFSVVHKVNHQPFKVITGQDVAIEVLGTTFNVYHRDETKVVLNSGRIQLSLPSVHPNEKVFMNPGELVEYNEKKYVKRKVDPSLYTSWTENNLVLNHTSLREMVRLIKDNYGIEVDVKENLLDQTISGSMPVTSSDNLLQQIAIAFRLKLVKEQNKIYMRE